MLDMIRNSISQTPEAAALFYDELARIIQNGGIDPKIEVALEKTTLRHDAVDMLQLIFSTVKCYSSFLGVWL